jgi:hypothetical protein
MQNFLRRYFELMGIPVYDETGISKVFQFANMLGYFTLKFKTTEASIPSSKCAGIIYILAICYPGRIQEQSIKEYCMISKGTYSRFSNVIMRLLLNKDPKYTRLRRKLRRLFIRYEINYPTVTIG